MATNPDNAFAAVGGAVGVGGDAFVAPTSGSGAVTGLLDLGIVNEDGITEARDRSAETIGSWNGGTVRTLITDGSMTFSFILLETKREVVELYYGTEVDTDGSIVIDPKAQGPRKPMVFDYIDGPNSIRAYAPDTEVTEVGDKVYSGGELVGYEVTVTCYPSTELTASNGRPGAVKMWHSSLAE